MNDTGEAAADGVMPTSHADVMPNPKFLEGPPETARETYGPGEAETQARPQGAQQGSRGAGSVDQGQELAGRRARKFRDVKEASKWRAADYKLTRASGATRLTLTSTCGSAATSSVRKIARSMRRRRPAAMRSMSSNTQKGKRREH